MELTTMVGIEFFQPMGSMWWSKKSYENHTMVGFSSSQYAIHARPQYEEDHGHAFFLNPCCLY